MTMKWCFALMGLLVAIDEGAKILVRHYIPIGHVTILLKNLLELTHVENTGVSFSFLSDMPDYPRVPLLIGVSVLAVGVMLYYLIRYWNDLDFLTKAALTWTIPGAMGNLIDRVFFGALTDFLHFRWFEISFFVNNLADCFISLGVVFFILATFIGQKQNNGVTDEVH